MLTSSFSPSLAKQKEAEQGQAPRVGHDLEGVLGSVSSSFSDGRERFSASQLPACWCSRSLSAQLLSWFLFLGTARRADREKRCGPLACIASFALAAYSLQA